MDTRGPRYGLSRMVMTPWGDASQLRTRKMRPGGGSRREQTERSQRERLFAAMVATRRREGLRGNHGRRSDRALGRLAEHLLRFIFATSRTASWRRSRRWWSPSALERVAEDGLAWAEDKARQAFEALIELIVSQPAASKMCFVEIYAAGAPAVELLDRDDRRFRGARGGDVRADARARGDAAGDRQGDHRRRPEGCPQAPAARRGAGADRACARSLALGDLRSSSPRSPPPGQAAIGQGDQVRGSPGAGESG